MTLDPVFNWINDTNFSRPSKEGGNLPKAGATLPRKRSPKGLYQEHSAELGTKISCEAIYTLEKRLKSYVLNLICTESMDENPPPLPTNYIYIALRSGPSRLSRTNMDKYVLYVIQDLGTHSNCAKFPPEPLFETKST